MDWLAGGDRRELAVERIYDAAAELVAARGLNRLSVDDVAKRAGCSRATVYRHAGGKNALRDAVLARAIAGIVASVREAVAPSSGEQRVVDAIIQSLNAIRADPVFAALLSGTPVNSSLVASPRLADTAAELAGLVPGDCLAAHWVVRVVLALLSWPLGEPAAEDEVVRRFVAPVVTAYFTPKQMNSRFTGR